MRKLWVLSLLGWIACSNPIRAQWNNLANMPTGLWGGAVTSCGPNIYFFGGSQNSSAGNAAFRYNIPTNTWTSLSPLPTPRTYGSAVATPNGSIFVIGGNMTTGSLNTVEEYNCSTDTWIPRAPMQTPRMGFGATYYQGKIYVFGGWNSGLVSSVEVFDPAANSWVYAAPLPFPVYQVQAATVGDRIYIIGGYNGNPVDLNQIYDPLTNTWSNGSPMHFARYLHGITEAGGNIIAVGGYPASSSVELYNPSSNSWVAAAPLLTPRYRISVASFQNCLYVTGGYTGSMTTDTQESNCSIVALATELIRMQVREENGIARLNWQDEAKGTLHYEIQSAEMPGGTPRTEARVDAHNRQSYSYDLAVESGKPLWVRIVAEDADGKMRNSDWAALDAGRNDQAWFTTGTTVEGGKSLEVFFPGESPWIHLQTLDIQGRVLHEERVDNPPPGQFLMNLPPASLAKDITCIRISNGREILYGKIGL